MNEWILAVCSTIDKILFKETLLCSGYPFMIFFLLWNSSHESTQTHQKSSCFFLDHTWNRNLYITREKFISRIRSFAYDDYAIMMIIIVQCQCQNNAGGGETLMLLFASVGCSCSSLIIVFFFSHNFLLFGYYFLIIIIIIVVIVHFGSVSFLDRSIVIIDRSIDRIQWPIDRFFN